MSEETQYKSAESLFNWLSYPKTAWARQAYRSPLLFWRMGFGPVIGRLVLILTTLGRKSGKVRRTPLEYHRVDGRIFVFNAWPQSDWFQNIQAEPRVTVQTNQGAMSAEARVLDSYTDYYQAHRVIENNVLIRSVLEASGLDVSLTGFLASRDRFRIVTFDPIDIPTPPPLETDLRWVAPALLTAFALGYLVGKESSNA